MRAELLVARRERAAGDVSAARAAVRAVVLNRATAAGWRCVAAYVPLRTEPGSLELLDCLVATGVRVLVPVLLPDNDLDWAEWDARSGASGAPVGVREIEAADAVLVPALAVARDGTRLGRGGGSYDRALRRARPGAVVVALLFDGELVDALPRDEWDVPVTAVVLPSGWHAVG